MDEATRVLIVDDQVLYREGLRELMRHWPEFDVIGEASNGAEAIAFCESSVPDMILMDVQMPVMGGVEAAEAISKAYPDVFVIMLTVTADDQTIFSALQAGARGYLLKHTPSSQLRNRLHEAMLGEATLSGEIATKLIDRIINLPAGYCSDEEGKRLANALSEREVDILRLVAQGLSNEEIGAKLYLSSGTVKKQLRSLMQKLDLSNRVQVAVYAIRSGLVE